MTTKVSSTLHRLAERALVLEDRLKRLEQTISETRGNSLQRAYREGEFDAVTWVLSLVDMDMPWKKVVQELETFCRDSQKVPSIARPSEHSDDNDSQDEDEHE